MLILFSLLTIISLYTVIFHNIPALVKNDSFLNWVWLGIGLNALMMCSFQVGIYAR